MTCLKGIYRDAIAPRNFVLQLADHFTAIKSMKKNSGKNNYFPQRGKVEKTK